jgi:hypothetical protein
MSIMKTNLINKVDYVKVNDKIKDALNMGIIKR